ncbi:hypothetical protein LCGC14_3135790 [marine sediment metagenome]|uniref:Uncharacterized protein n=1 Tax=marine sediment metagenome TaxID=412755 RepID=A0A0F8VYD6_9ZZZZ
MTNKEQQQRFHSIERTSPKGPGEPFIGVCVLCGAENLTFNNTHDRCENKPGLTEGEALEMSIRGPVK